MMPKQFKPVQFETLDHVREQIRIKIDGCLDSIVEILVEIHPVCEKAYKAPLEELPLLMGQSESSDEIIKHRLSGKDNHFDMNFEPFHEVMADHAFSVDEYKWIGELDGQLSLLGDLAAKLGMDYESQKANAAVYSFD